MTWLIKSQGPSSKNFPGPLYPLSRLWMPRRYCCNFSGGVALIVWFTTNGMYVKNNTIHTYMWREQAIIEWSWRELCCCLLPQSEALRICHLGFPMATPAPRKFGGAKCLNLGKQPYFWLGQCFTKHKMSQMC